MTNKEMEACYEKLQVTRKAGLMKSSYARGNRSKYAHIIVEQGLLFFDFLVKKIKKREDNYIMNYTILTRILKINDKEKVCKNINRYVPIYFENQEISLERKVGINAYGKYTWNIAKFHSKEFFDESFHQFKECHFSKKDFYYQKMLALGLVIVPQLVEYTIKEKFNFLKEISSFCEIYPAFSSKEELLVWWNKNSEIYESISERLPEFYVN
jgi:hypothetical protein